MSTSPPRESRNQLAAGAFLALWSLAGWWSFATAPALHGDQYGVDPGPGLLPLIVLATLSLGALILIGRGIGRIASEPGDARYWRRLIAGSGAPMLFLASLIAYVWALAAIGYLIASSLIAFVWIAALGLRTGEQGVGAALLQAAVATVIGVGTIYFVFVSLIGVPLR